MPCCASLNRRPDVDGIGTLVGFGGAAGAAAFAGTLRERYGPSFPVSVVENAGNAVSIPLGLGLATYTGVLIGTTAIPVWNQNIGDLPMHFAASGLGAAVGVFELIGHSRSCAGQALGLGAAIFETWEGIRITSHPHRLVARRPRPRSRLATAA